MALIKQKPSGGMIVYNVTTAVATEKADEWLQWMVQEHGPDVINTGCFTRFHVLRLLQVDDSEGPTFAIQYYAESMYDYERYLKEYAPKFRQQIAEMWGNAVVSFRTVMQLIQ